MSPWIYYPDAQPNEELKDTDYKGNWWTSDIQGVEIQLTADTVQQTSLSFAKAYEKRLPLKILFKNPIKAKWRKIRTHKRGYDQLRIVQYCNGILTGFYDPDKIKSLATDSVSAYYRFSELPETLKSFLEGSR